MVETVSGFGFSKRGKPTNCLTLNSGVSMVTSQLLTTGRSVPPKPVGQRFVSATQHLEICILDTLMKVDIMNLVN